MFCAKFGRLGENSHRPSNAADALSLGVVEPAERTGCRVKSEMWRGAADDLARRQTEK